MLAKVTNRAGGARGFETRDRGTVLVEPGACATLDLADHPAHRAWAAAGEVLVEAVDDRVDGGPPASRRPAKGRASPT